MLRNGYLKNGYQLWQKEEERRKYFQYCVNPNSSTQFLYLRAIQGHSRDMLLIRSCKTMYCNQTDLPSTSTTSGTRMN